VRGLARARRHLGATAAALGVAAVFAGGANAEDLATTIPLEDAASRPFAITTDADGNVWFTDPGAQKIGKLAPGGGPAMFPAPNAGKGIVFRPEDDLSVQPDSIWYTTTNGKLAQMTMTGQYPGRGPWTMDAGADLRGITYRVGPNNQEFAAPVWIAASGPGATFRLWLSAVGETPDLYHYGWGINTPPVTPTARDVVVGPGNRLFITTDAGVELKDPSDPNDYPPAAIPGSPPYAYAIAAAPDDTLWVTHAGGVTRMDAHGVTLPGGVALSTGTDPHGIAMGPDEAAWFTESGTNKVGRVAPGEPLRETTLPGCSAPEDITTSGDSLYVTCSGSNALVKIVPNGAPPAAPGPPTMPAPPPPMSVAPLAPPPAPKGSVSLKRKIVRAGARFAVTVRFTHALTKSRVRVQYRSHNVRAKGAIRRYRGLATKLVTGTSAALPVKIGRAGVYRLRISFVNADTTTFVKAVKVTVKPNPMPGADASAPGAPGVQRP
jgi:virginiamycin B lyase